jgi:small subunit ribosomal protein S4
MARYTGPTCKLARREGTDLFLKSGSKPLENKCKLTVPPGGLKGERRTRLSDYGLQLREKQKLRRMYGVLERQFGNYYEEAARKQGATGENLLKLLECRLDNVVYRMGFAASRKAARQLIRHRHVEINQKTVDVPSYLVDPGEEVRVRMKSREMTAIMAAMDQSTRGAPLSWIAVDRDTFSGRMLERPQRTSIPIAAQEQLVVELYSK